jgi:hypothetical protein
MPLTIDFLKCGLVQYPKSSPNVLTIAADREEDKRKKIQAERIV